MLKLMQLVIVALMLTAIQSAPLENQEMVIDDMVLDADQYNYNRKLRNIIFEEKYRWPNATLLYSFDTDIAAADRVTVRNTMNYMESLTCIKFVEVDETVTKRVFIQGSSSGCSSVVGYRGNTQRLYYSQPYCFHPNTIAHELMHALGMYHQHSAMDRDDYVRVNYDNINPGEKYAYKKLPEAFDHGLGYDYDSIMHYGGNGNSKNGLPTMEALCPNVVLIGPRQKPIGLSDKDVKKLKLMYKCPGWEEIETHTGPTPCPEQKGDVIVEMNKFFASVIGELFSVS